ncbi:MAG: hypothetical protein R3F65_30050 [bacterium]
MELPSYGGVPEGIYLDAVQALCAYGAGKSLGERLSTAWEDLGGDDGAFAVTISAADRVVITFTEAAAERFRLTMTPGLALLGWPASPGWLAPGIHAAPSDWVRGTYRAPPGGGSPGLRLERQGEGSILIPLPWAQDVRCLIRGSAAFDLDAPAAACLADRDRLWTGLDISHGVDAEGHAWWSAVGVRGPVVWASATLRDRLGYSGSEAEVIEFGAHGTITHCRAARPLPGVLAPSRGLTRRARWTRVHGAETELLDGRYATAHRGRRRGWHLEALCDGPDDVRGDLTPLWVALRDEWAPPGHPIALWQDLGDSRRRRHPLDVSVDAPAYSLLHTSEDVGGRGRILARVDPGSGREVDVDVERPFRRRAPIELSISDREEGV